MNTYFKSYNKTQIINFTKGDFLSLKNKNIRIHFKEIGKQTISGKVIKLGFSIHHTHPQLPFDLTLQPKEDLNTVDIGIQQIKRIELL